MVTAVYTKWGWVSRKALYRFKEAHRKATGPLFTLNDYQWDKRFIGHLIDFLESEGLIAEKTDEEVTLFEQEQGHA